MKIKEIILDETYVGQASPIGSIKQDSSKNCEVKKQLKKVVPLSGNHLTTKNVKHSGPEKSVK